MTSQRRLALALLWLAALLIAGWAAQDANTQPVKPHAARAADASETATIALQL